MRRPRGTGRIYRQKNSNIWWIKFYRNGVPFRESTGTSDKRKATRALNHRLAWLWCKWRVPHSDTVLFWGAWCWYE
jgi:hypothetical protein